MKRNACLLLCVLLSVPLLSQETPGQSPSKIKLENADFSIPAEDGVVGWSCLNRDWPGTLEVKTDEQDCRYLRVTPLKSPTQFDAKKKPKCMSIVYGGTKFNAAAGDRVRVRFQVRISQGAAGGPVLDNGRSLQWLPGFRSSGAVAGQWNDYSAEYTIKETKSKQESGKYSLDFLVEHAPVDIRRISLILQPVAK